MATVEELDAAAVDLSTYAYDNVRSLQESSKRSGITREQSIREMADHALRMWDKYPQDGERNVEYWKLSRK